MCASYNAAYCGWTDGDGAYIPADQLGEDLLYSTYGGNPTVYPAGTGIATTDFAVYTFAAAASKCTGGVLAYAATCQRDQHDRPVLGAINICPNQINVNSLSTQLLVVLHELGHALAFSASSFPLFRLQDADRTPRTPRHSFLPARIATSLE
jgi:leishmanolysin-like peptidase